MQMNRHGWLVVCAAVVAISTTAIVRAADPKQPPSVLAGQPDSSTSTGQGDLFESPGAGIAVRPPAGCKEIRRPGVPDTIVEFVNDQRGWQIRVLKTELVDPMPLDEYRDDNGNKVNGFLQQTLNNFRQANPVAKILRQEVTKAGGYDAAIIASRFTQGAAQGVTRRLFQEAMIPLTLDPKTKSAKLFYVISMTSPGAKTDDDTKIDLAEKEAADAFSDMIDSVKLLDRGAIRRDQDERLLRTRQLLPSLMKPDQVKKALISEQWLRLIRDGKDVGYTYVTEGPGKMDAFSGTEITLRSHTLPIEGTTVDVLSRMFVADNWTYETWMHSATANETKEKKPPQTNMEFGITDHIHRFVVNDNPDPSRVVDPKHPEMKEVDQWRMEVRSQVGKLPKKPYVLENLPPWYVPQATWYLLPRLVPLDHPQTYMFCSYVSEYAEVMSRYVDVGAQQKGGFLGAGNQTIIPVKTRVGLEGVVTTYYLTPEGKYLGSESIVNADGQKSVIQVMCTDAATLTKLWPQAKLLKPQSDELPDMPRLKRELPARTKGVNGQLP